jgi:phosphatidylglycerophosphate synthase
MKVTIKDIKEAYSHERPNEKKFVWTYYVRRPISYYLAWCCLRLGISANNVTLSFLFVGIIGCALLASGIFLFLVIGALLIELSNILDCVDGHIARIKRGTYVGTCLDSWAGEAVFVSSMFSLGIGLSKVPSSSYVSSFPVKGIWFLYLGFFAALAALSAWAVRNHWLSISPRPSDDMQPDTELRSSGLVIVTDNLFHYSGAYAPLMIVSVVLRLSPVFLILVFAVYGAFLFVLMAIIMKKAYLLDVENS